MTTEKKHLEERLKKSLGKVVSELMDFAGNAETQIKILRSKLSHIDKTTAKATLGQLSVQGLAELAKAQETIQKHVDSFSKDLQGRTKKLGRQTGKIVRTTKSTIKDVKKQIKTLTEAERTKRRGRRRSG